jgi:type II secretory ATPase GspE/PulE/Tfp pilus assembly ATPase PilB-like protein
MSEPLHEEKRFYSEPLMGELSQLLEERQLVSPDQMQEVMSRQTLTGTPMYRLLIEEALLAEDQVLGLVSELTGLRFAHLADVEVDPEASKAIHARVAHRYQIIPVAVTDEMVTMATSSVPDMATVEGLKMLLEKEIDWVLCTQADLSKTLTHFYGLGAETLDALIAAAEDDDDDDDTEGLDVSEDSDAVGIVRFINQAIAEAIRMEATDIHIEPFEDTLRLRYRIDGIMQVISLPQGVGALRRSVASAVKIMANMDIAERRKPHDGRIKARLGKREFDLRVSVLPASFGETVNMRILSRNSTHVDIANLGLSDDQLPKITEMCELPHGVVLLTGPTGSGKTTTLYALLARISSTELKVITVEDPIEYQMEGISQIQTHSKIGLTFASILRSILRHDPDVILIGEIRDAETADIAVRASLTGHLVFSTLHTNDAPSAVTRLSDMGIEPYLISSCLEGVIAQRLVRRVCGSCAEQVTPPALIVEEIREQFPNHPGDFDFRQGVGCPDCSFTGYHGRNALIEVMVVDDAIRQLIVQRSHSNEIKELAMARGMHTLRMDGWRRVLQGLTSVDEVMRVARKGDG